MSIGCPSFPAGKRWRSGIASHAAERNVASETPPATVPPKNLQKRWGILCNSPWNMLMLQSHDLAFSTEGSKRSTVHDLQRWSFKSHRREPSMTKGRSESERDI
jgi:hypothetical protein